MLLLYISWDDKPIFMISASNEQLQQQLKYTLLKPDCYSRWISKMQSGREDILEKRYAIKFGFKLRKNAMRWKLDLLLWPIDQETEFPVEEYWLSQTQEGQTEQIHPQTFDDPFFWQHWHDLHALCSHWIDSQQGILCWGFKGVQEEIPREEASTLQIGSVAFPPGQYASSQLHLCHRLFGHQDTLSPSLLSRSFSLWLLALIIPHRLPAFLESLMPLKTDAQFMQDGRKEVWSIPYVSVAFFSKLKTEFYCISFF